MPGDSNYLSQRFRQTASLGLLEAKGTSRLDVEVQAISSTLRSVYAWEADVCYPLVHASGNLLHSDEEGLWKSLYSTQIHVGSGTTIPHAFLTTFPCH